MPGVLGVDPSLSGTGLAWGDDATSTCGGTGDQRLWVITHAIRELGRLDLAVVEDLPTHGMGAGKTGMAQGAVRLALMSTLTPYVLVPPATLKTYATGRGNATKPDMRVSMLSRFGTDLRDENQVDAWWLRAMGMDYLGAPIVTLPQTHRRALDKVEWPALGGAA